MKILLRLLFVATFGCAYAFVDSVFMRKSVHTSKIKSFFSQSKEYDVLAFGPSYMYCTFSPPELFRRYGLRSFVMGSPCQPINETAYFIKEALKVSTAKVVVLCADMIVFSPDLYIHKSSFVHEALDGFPSGCTRIGMIMNLHTDSSIDEFLFPLVKYHERWKVLNNNDFLMKHIQNDYLGHMFYVGGSFTNDVTSYSLDDFSRADVFQENLEYLDQIKRIVDAAGASLILLSAPRHKGTADGRLASLHDYADRNKIDFIDLNLDFDKTGISNATDFYNGGHLNVFGAEKATRYIGKYLVDHFDFNTNITAECRAEWDAEVARYDRAKAAAIAAERKANKR